MIIGSHESFHFEYDSFFMTESEGLIKMKKN